MNHAAMLLKTPWVASQRSSRWLALVVLLICMATTALAAIGMHDRARLIIPALLWCLGLGCWWLLVVGNALFVARDARALCLPRWRRVANASVLVHAALTVLLPALVLGAWLGHPLAWIVGFALVVSLCMLFLLLPSGFMFLMILVGSLGVNLLHPHRPELHALLEIALVPMLALAALAAWLWLRLQQGESPAALGFNVPLIWSLRLQSLYGFGARGANPDKVLARASATWFAPMPDLRGLGPARPTRSLRVALGRNLMPQTWASMARQLGLSLAIIVVFSVLPIAGQAGNHDFRAFMAALFLPHPGAFAAPVVIACVIATLAFAIFPAPLRARWSAGSAELPLLALLPGLGDPKAARRHVMSAALTQTAGVAAVEFAILCGIAAWAGVLATSIVTIGLCVVCTAALATACILGVLAARPLAWPVLVILGSALLLAVAVAMASAFADGDFAARAAAPASDVLAVLLVVLLARCWRAWRALQRRPHPFLAGTP